ncbi:thioredoxin family protein [Compostibacter hankyongensis]|uniref:Thioredoxin family protein n=2 Tax=Compostibacter hankyongensis TaxID=1007089 RepID=A0ABP8FGH9_9BACT
MTTAVLLLAPFFLHAQLLTPVKWTFSAHKMADKTYELHMTARIDKGWHVYAQQSGQGPIPASFRFEDTSGIRRDGAVQEKGALIEKQDPVFDSRLRYFENEVDFVQRVTVTAPDARVKGSLEYMACNDKECLPPKTVPFSFVMAGGELTVASAPAAALGGSRAAPPAAAAPDTTASSPEGIPEDASRISLWAIFLLGLGAGFAALIMPCIYAMIPVTVSFFTKRSETRKQGIRNAVYYSASIILIFTLLGFLGTLIFGPRAMNQLSSSAVFNIFVFVLFLIFGISFLGAFEIVLPGTWTDKINARSGLGSFTGIFFMALTLVVVSFSCTAPFIGNLLVWTARGGILGPVIGFFGFSLALAVPFALFAVFPGLLNRLAKSGGWLNTVKVSMGFIELALALKFLSSADLAYHWRLLDREVYLSLWIVIFGLLGLYLLGKLKLAHDSDVPYLTVTRLFFAIAALSFTVYMIPGLWGAPLKGISAWLPEMRTQDFNLYDIQTSGISGTAPASASGIRPKRYTDILHSEIPGVAAFFDYDEAITAARAEKKPLMIDFTGHSCANCRRMEREVLSDPEVRRMLQNDFVVASLYVDDRTALPEEERYISKLDGGKIGNMGAKNLDFEAMLINSNAQPNYVFVDQNGKVLLNAGGYDADIERFKGLLRSALEKYRQGNP